MKSPMFWNIAKQKCQNSNIVVSAQKPVGAPYQGIKNGIVAKHRPQSVLRVIPKCLCVRIARLTRRPLAAIPMNRGYAARRSPQNVSHALKVSAWQYSAVEIQVRPAVNPQSHSRGSWLRSPTPLVILYRRTSTLDLGMTSRWSHHLRSLGRLSTLLKLTWTHT